MTKTTSIYRKKYPERYKANNEVCHALKVGLIQKHPCFICGKKAEAHHPDYSRPLDVMWLCTPHHKETHALAKVSF
jgi:hypothetical protein